jgi:hypothetical protein
VDISVVLGAAEPSDSSSSLEELGPDSLVMTVPTRSAWLAGSAQPGMDLDFDLDFNLPVRTGYSPIRLFDIADDPLSPMVDVDVLDPNELVPSVPQSAQNLHLHCECPHQTSRGGSECRNASLRSKPAVHFSKYCHCRCVIARHLNGESTLNFIPRCGRLDHGERAIDRQLRNSAIGRTGH